MLKKVKFVPVFSFLHYYLGAQKTNTVFCFLYFFSQFYRQVRNRATLSYGTLPKGQALSSIFQNHCSQLEVIHSPTKDFWQYLEMLLVVAPGAGGCYWHLVGIHLTMHRAALTRKNYAAPSVSSAKGEGEKPCSRSITVVLISKMQVRHFYYSYVSDQDKGPKRSCNICSRCYVLAPLLTALLYAITSSIPKLSSINPILQMKENGTLIVQGHIAIHRQN